MDKTENYIQGLTSDQVNQRISQGYVNTTIDSGAKTTKQIIKDNLLTYFNAIFLLLAFFVCVAGSFRSLTFLPVVIGNTLIGIIQEIRARNIIEKMSILNAPHAVVIRNGIEQKITSDLLVKDDLIIFQAGDQIPVDAKVIEGNIRVNESLLTGESDEIEKMKESNLLSGSFVISGKCIAKAEKVGSDSYISKLTLEAKEHQKQEQSEMIKSINRLILVVGILIIPIGIILFYQGYFVNKESFRDSIVSMVAAIIGMIPEGLYLLTTIALVVSTMRLAQKKVLLHDMKSIETLARVDILCVDKTGTITENHMTVQDIVPLSEKENIRTVLYEFLNVMTLDNVTMQALKDYFAEDPNVGVESNYRAKKIISFSSEKKYCSVIFEEGTYILGAPENVLRDAYQTYQENIEKYAKKGYRVLVFGKYQGEWKEPLKEMVEPYALVLMSNPIRKQAKKTFQYFEKQNVRINVISGDNPETVSEVALKAGILHAENYVDARFLKTKEDIEEAVKKYTVFGRVTPKQKQMLVNAWKKEGHTVAMTGDGVNDILAMKEADCSVAMASGSEATAQAAQVVLLDSDFSAMPSVVLEGRRVVNNIQRSASLFLVKNIFSFLMSIFSVVVLITYPLEPSQVSLISLFDIGLPAFLLAMEPNENRIEGKFMKNVFLKALPAGLTDVLSIGALVICGIVFDLPSEDIATAATVLLAMIGFMILTKISRPLNKYRIAVLIGNAVAFLICCFLLSDLFALKGMSDVCILLFIIFAFASESLFRLLSQLVEKTEIMVQKKIHFWRAT